MSRADPAAPDGLLGGRLLLRQPASGHRVGTDAVLLAAAIPAEAAGLLVDLGAGVGPVGLAAALTRPGLRLLLVDQDEDALALASDNAARNGLADRSAIAAADILGPDAARRAAGLRAGVADWVATNPPFGSDAVMRASPDPRRAAAHVMPPDGLARWIGCAADLLKPRGTLLAIHRADALAEVLAALAAAFGGVAIRPVAPRAERAATRILVRAVKGARAPLAILPPLVLHEAGGRFTAEADAIHRGDAPAFP